MRTTMALLCLLTLGCSSLTGGGSSELTGDVAALKARVLELQRQTTADQVEIERLRQRLSELEVAVEERATASAEESDVRGIDREEVPAPRRVEVIEVADLEEPLEEDAPAVAEDQSDSPPTQQTQEVTATAQALYDQGYSLYHQGRHVQAEETFQRFLEAYSDTDLADNAQYWIGECLLGRNELQAALAAFRETVRRYPQGNKAPDALYKVGVVMERLGDIEGARATYAEVQRRFPDSPVSGMASSRLEAL